VEWINLAQDLYQGTGSFGHGGEPSESIEAVVS
jgi:hypothetical protein